MNNAPEKNGYNTEMQRMARLARMEFRTTEPYSPWENKSEIVLKIIKVNYNRRRVKRNIPNRVWEFGMF